LPGPFVGLFGQDRADEADDGGAVGKDPDDVGAAADPLFNRSCGLFDQVWRQISFGNAVRVNNAQVPTRYPARLAVLPDRFPTRSSSRNPGPDDIEAHRRSDDPAGE
jgi:hypothetical protein